MLAKITADFLIWKPIHIVHNGYRWLSQLYKPIYCVGVKPNTLKEEVKAKLCPLNGIVNVRNVIYRRVLGTLSAEAFKTFSRVMFSFTKAVFIFAKGK